MRDGNAEDLSVYCYEIGSIQNWGGGMEEMGLKGGEKDRLAAQELANLKLVQSVSQPILVPCTWL